MDNRNFAAAPFVPELSPAFYLSQKRIYLASPYTHPEFRTREQRYREAAKATAYLMEQGDLVFSPVVHSHTVACSGSHSMPVDFGFWKTWCLSFIEHWATDFWILKMEGWLESRGIAAELDFVKKLNRQGHEIIINSVKWPLEGEF